MPRVLNQIRERTRTWPRLYYWAPEQIAAKVERGEAAVVSPIPRFAAEFFLKCLEEPFQSVMRLYLNGVRPTQIAQMTGTSKYHVTRRLAVAKVTIRTMYAVWESMLTDKEMFAAFMRGKQCSWCKSIKEAVCGSQDSEGR